MTLQSYRTLQDCIQVNWKIPKSHSGYSLSFHSIQSRLFRISHIWIVLVENNWQSQRRVLNPTADFKMSPQNPKVDITDSYIDINKHRTTTPLLPFLELKLKTVTKPWLLPVTSHNIKPLSAQSFHWRDSSINVVMGNPRSVLDRVWFLFRRALLNFLNFGNKYDTCFSMFIDSLWFESKWGQAVLVTYFDSVCHHFANHRLFTFSNCFKEIPFSSRNHKQTCEFGCIRLCNYVIIWHMSVICLLTASHKLQVILHEAVQYNSISLQMKAVTNLYYVACSLNCEELSDQTPDGPDGWPPSVSWLNQHWKKVPFSHSIPEEWPKSGQSLLTSEVWGVTWGHREEKIKLLFSAMSALQTWCWPGNIKGLTWDQYV